MKHWGKFFLAILALSLLSYSIPTVAYAAVEPISVTVEEFYSEGDKITISGSVKDFDPSDPMKSSDVSILIIAPNGNIVTVAQVPPSSDGSYSTSFTAGGMINTEGNYVVKVKWGAQANGTEFKYGGSSGAPPTVAQEQEAVVIEAVEGEMEPEPESEAEPAMTQPICGPGTVLKNNVCVAGQQGGGGCLIATAAFGSEMAPQVQFLKEIRDSTVLQTQSGSAFMTGFNQFYYYFSPTIADYDL